MSYTDADIEELISRSKCYDVLTRYCRALDRADVALMRSVYWDDGIDNHGVFNGNAAEFAEFIVAEIQQWFDVTMHAIANVHMEVHGDTVYSEAYLSAYHKVRGDRDKVEEIFGSRYLSGFDWSKVEGVPHDFIFGGRYIDRLERRGGEWRIAKRQVVMDWNRNDIGRTILDEGMFATLRPLGTRGPSDLVFANRP